MYRSNHRISMTYVTIKNEGTNWRLLWEEIKGDGDRRDGVEMV